MFSWLKNIWNILKNLVKFATHSVQSIFVLIANIPRFILYITSLLAEIPPIYLAFALVTLTISIVFLIINRIPS